MCARKQVVGASTNIRFGSALGQKRTYRSANVMSALPPKADIRQRRIGKLWTAGNQLRFIYLPT
jgi:hypothetical protein